MRRFNARPNLRDEQGAILPLVALSIVAIMGMVVITLDVGALLTKRRSLVNAADAAALGAAQSCGRKEGETSATAVAQALAVANEAGASIVSSYPIYEPSCDAASGRVTVRLTATQDTSFAPTLGFADQHPVVTEAVGLWGGVGGGDFVPFMLSEGTLLDCDIGTDVILGGYIPGEDEEIFCTFWMNNKVEEMGSSQWAMLNLNTAASGRWGWNVAADYASCVPANTNETLTWIHDGASGLSLNYPAPTYVCVDTGATPPTFNALAQYVGVERLFPVSDPGIPGSNPQMGYTDVRLNTESSPYPHGQVNRAGEPCPLPCEPGNGGYGNNGPIDKYDVVGFAKLEIFSVERGNQGGEITCALPDATPRPRDSNAWCLKVRFKGYYTDLAEIGEGDNFNVTVVRLIR